MNYKRIYESLCIRAYERTISEYGENHHVQPKCLGGSNDKSNIVRLTAREHYLAHKLLCRIFPENHKLAYAFWSMCNGSRPGRPNTNSRNYEEARLLFIEARPYMPSGMKGKKHSQETKDKVSATKRGQTNNFWIGRKHSEESKLKQSEAAKKRSISPEMEAERRRKISEKMKGVPKSAYK